MVFYIFLSASEKGCEPTQGFATEIMCIAFMIPKALFCDYFHVV